MPSLGNKFFQLPFSRISAYLKVPQQNMYNLLKPPEAVLGMTVLKRELFDKVVEVPVLILKDIKLSSVVPVLKKYLLKVENLKPIQHATKEVLIYLNPLIVKQWDDISEDDRQKLFHEAIKKDCLKNIPYTFNYDNFSAEDILRAVLPPDKEGLSSFTKVGHIVHVNLREHLLPYKNVIAKILFDKVPGCRTVVNKANIIDNTYRNFEMEVLTGDPDMLTTIKENNCRFKFDFSKVYWNSRLCTEHERIVKKLQGGDILFDVFAGVGPFAVPAGKKKCTVFANDLNPESFNWLKYNFEENKVNKTHYNLYNKDGHDFIKDDVKMHLPKFLESGKNVYITMNLPAMALEFLNDFVGLFKNETLPEYSKPPLIYVYCFAKGEDYMEITKNKIKETVSYDLSDKIVDIFRVRSVSSLKEMMRVTLRLERDILIADRKRKLDDDSSEVENKKAILGDNNGKEQEETK
ncbi:unnamed protein product [Acanthoscelides obtectus]|uniref:tRNA (guanine(37)-N1)-methyltransferase n=2 Tax=Acanthoscelides obtectus TaxID=200917 RepID=A0A9P0KFW9_ACAOB|nr:unnamed protein product [Acanthoscelides obtectus]CAK1666693.1 tRNA (guanine(37)-N1)-methyltransferase [Acanthoscelides obtectus]